MALVTAGRLRKRVRDDVRMDEASNRALPSVDRRDVTGTWRLRQPILRSRQKVPGSQESMPALPPFAPEPKLNEERAGRPRNGARTRADGRRARSARVRADRRTN